MQKIISLVLFYVIFTVILIVYFVFYHHSVNLKKGIYINRPEAITHFELIDTQGNVFNEKKLKGHWSLLFFGFSSCEMVCPLTLKMLKETYEGLPEAQRPQVIFISVDPEYDSLQRLNQFVHSFNEQFIALRGSLEAIQHLQKQLHVLVSTMPKSHGTEILLVNPKGEVQTYFYYPLTSQELLKDIQHVEKL